MTVLQCHYGESLKSMETWARRWNWSRGKVRRFFRLLAGCSMIVAQPDHKTTRLKVCNYESYQNPRPDNETQSPGKRTSNGHQTDTDNNENNENNENKGKDSPKHKARTYRIGFDYETEQFTGITDTDWSKWSEAFPAVDVRREAKCAALWLRDNPTKRKKNVQAFLGRWFGRSQEKGGNGKEQKTPGQIWLEAQNDKS